jgi:hypothetical protein
MRERTCSRQYAGHTSTLSIKANFYASFVQVVLTILTLARIVHATRNKKRGSSSLSSLQALRQSLPSTSAKPKAASLNDLPRRAIKLSLERTKPLKIDTHVSKPTETKQTQRKGSESVSSKSSDSVGSQDIGVKEVIVLGSYVRNKLIAALSLRH